MGVDAQGGLEKSQGQNSRGQKSLLGEGGVDAHGGQVHHAGFWKEEESLVFKSAKQCAFGEGGVEAHGGQVHHAGFLNREKPCKETVCTLGKGASTRMAGRCTTLAATTSLAPVAGLSQVLRLRAATASGGGGAPPGGSAVTALGPASRTSSLHQLTCKAFVTSTQVYALS